MAKTLDEMLAERPVNREAVDRHKKRMIDEMRSYRLRELREAVEMTQVQLAERLDISQTRVSRIEHGDIERTQVDTLRKYAEAIGGRLKVEVEFGEDTVQIA